MLKNFLFPKTTFVFESDMPPQEIFDAAVSFCKHRKTFDCTVPRNQGEGPGRRFSLGRYTWERRKYYSRIDVSVDRNGEKSVIAVDIQSPVLKSGITYLASLFVLLGVAWVCFGARTLDPRASLFVFFALLFVGLDRYHYRNDVYYTRELFEIILGEKKAQGGS